MKPRPEIEDREHPIYGKATMKHPPATPLPPEIRVAKDGITRERYDHFSGEWHAMPSYWTDRECVAFVAALFGVAEKLVNWRVRA